MKKIEEPVSYTHLDVYKRQLPYQSTTSGTEHTPAPSSFGSFWCGSSPLGTPETVSYTHLDTNSPASGGSTCSNRTLQQEDG